MGKLKKRREIFNEILELIKVDEMVNMSHLISRQELGREIEEQIKNSLDSKKELRKRTNRELLAILTIEQMYKYNEIELNQIQVSNMEWFKEMAIIAAVVIDRL